MCEDARSQRTPMGAGAGEAITPQTWNSRAMRSGSWSNLSHTTTSEDQCCPSELESWSSRVSSCLDSEDPVLFDDVGPRPWCEALWRVSVIVAMALSQLTIFLLPYAFEADSCHNTLDSVSYHLGALALLGLYVTFQCLQGPDADPSPLKRQVVQYVLLEWLYMLISIMYVFLLSCWEENGILKLLFEFACTITWVVAVCSGLGAVQMRIELIETHFSQPIFGKCIRCVRYVCCCLLWLLAVTFTVASHVAIGWLPSMTRVQYSILNTVFSLTAGCIVLLVWRGLRIVIEATELPESQKQTYAAAEARWARTVIGRLLVTMILSCVFQALARFAYALIVTSPWGGAHFFVVDAFAETLCAVAEVYCLFIAVGFFQPQQPQICIERAGRPDGRKHIATEEKVWREKVRELAHRSIDVQALLEFWAKLGTEVMPHFDPHRSSVHDVVRQAVIPLSKLGPDGKASCSYADVVSSRQRPADAPPPLPECMVTHTWSNLFLHLIAAVLADALGKDEYERVAKHLAARNMEVLYSSLRAKGSLKRRYWICVFCVNQHAGICGGFGPKPEEGTAFFSKWDASRRDSVTGAVFSTCCCKHPKYFSDQPLPCEMNKFDDMLALLRQEVPRLRLVVAVDRPLNIFTRAWCVAELVEAHVSMIPSSVRLFSNKELDIDADDLSTYTKLATLTVADCESTWPEDRDAILGRIPSVSDFDAHLQAIIFGQRGILSRCFVGFGIVEAAALTARRVATLTQRHKEVARTRRQNKLGLAESYSSLRKLSQFTTSRTLSCASGLAQGRIAKLPSSGWIRRSVSCPISAAMPQDATPQLGACSRIGSTADEPFHMVISDAESLDQRPCVEEGPRLLKDAPPQMGVFSSLVSTAAEPCSTVMSDAECLKQQQCMEEGRAYDVSPQLSKDPDAADDEAGIDRV